MEILLKDLLQSTKYGLLGIKYLPSLEMFLIFFI